MPYVIKQKKCTQADGDSGTHTLSYTDGEGTKRDNCHTSEQNAEDQIAAIEGGPLDETDPMMFGGGGFADEEEYDGGISEIRALIRMALHEQAFGVEGVKTKSGVREQIGSIASSLFPGNEVGRVAGDKNHVRIHTETLFDSDNNIQSDAAKKIVSSLVKVPEANLSVSVGSDDRLSQRYRFQEVSWSDSSGNPQSLKIIFAGKAGTGIRGGGYQYEQELVDNFSQCVDGICYQNTDTKGVDVMLKLPSGGEVEVEVKKQNAKFGQPTLVYSFTAPRGFSPSSTTRSVENAELTAGLLNSTAARRMLSGWMDDVRKAYLLSMKNAGEQRPSMTEYSTQVTPTIYGDKRTKTGMWAYPKMKQSVRGIPASPEFIIEYYKNKKADYIQIQGKGLYHIGSANPIGFGSGDLPAIPTFESAIATAAATVDAEILTSGGNKVLRGTGVLDMSGLQSSPVTLDDMETIKRVVKAIQSQKVDESVRSFIREALIFEELTGRDKDEIKRIARKEAEKIASKKEIEKVFQKKFDTELKKALGNSFFGTPGKINKFVKDEIAKEIKAMFNDKVTQNQIADLTKAVMKKLYRELSFSSVQIMDRIKL